MEIEATTTKSQPSVSRIVIHREIGKTVFEHLEIGHEQQLDGDASGDLTLRQFRCLARTLSLSVVQLRSLLTLMSCEQLCLQMVASFMDQGSIRAA